MSFPTGLVVETFWPPHPGHRLLLQAAAAQVAHLVVLVCEHPDAPVPAADRASWLRQLYRGDNLADGFWIGNTPLFIHSLPGEAGKEKAAADAATRNEEVRQLLDNLALGPVQAVFGNDHEGQNLALALKALYVPIEIFGLESLASVREAQPEREAMARHLHPLVAAQVGEVPPAPVPRVVLLGAESSGKSTLCAALAEAFGTVWVPEYGRTLHEQKAGNLDFDDLLYIARRHAELEDEATERARNFLFCDTNAATTALYSYYYFHRCDPALVAMAAVCKQRYAHTFVCAPTVPFEHDNWRGPEALRSFQHGMVLMQLDFYGISYTLLEGTVAERVAQVQALIAVSSK
jgi:nicotinamide riboside kinase